MAHIFISSLYFWIYSNPMKFCVVITVSVKLIFIVLLQGKQHNKLEITFGQRSFKPNQAKLKNILLSQTSITADITVQKDLRRHLTWLLVETPQAMEKIPELCIARILYTLRDENIHRTWFSELAQVGQISGIKY